MGQLVNVWFEMLQCSPRTPAGSHVYFDGWFRVLRIRNDELGIVAFLGLCFFVWILHLQSEGVLSQNGLVNVWNSVQKQLNFKPAGGGGGGKGRAREGCVWAGKSVIFFPNITKVSASKNTLQKMKAALCEYPLFFHQSTPPSFKQIKRSLMPFASSIIQKRSTYPKATSNNP